MAAPTIFSPARRRAVRARMIRLQTLPDAPRYVLDDMVADIRERLAFVRHVPHKSLIVGDCSGALAADLRKAAGEAVEVEPAAGFDQESPLSDNGFDFIASLGMLDTANDLPGALVHLRKALAPGGLLIASFVGAGSLPALRAAMLAADGERPAPRLHPLVDARSGAQLLQRTGFADPVADSRSLTVRFASLDRLVGDLRGQGLSNALARPGPALNRAALEVAARAFGHGRSETFELLTLTGWRS